MVKSVDQAVDMLAALCRLPLAANYVEDTRRQAAADGLVGAIRSRDPRYLFEWLLRCFSFQGISDRAAAVYIDRHGTPSWEDLEASLAGDPLPCAKLEGLEAYRGCGYRKTAATCSNPPALAACPVPTLPLRKGDLNQTAVSLFFFIRDRCRGDLPGFIDQELAAVDRAKDGEGAQAARSRLVDAFSEVYGISAKLINMTLAMLLMGDPTRRAWDEVGRLMVAVDTLVHNFLWRTGILSVFESNHRYGPACYRPNGCAEIIYGLAKGIARRYRNVEVFPRLLQYAIWSFCAERQLNICNGHQIDDRHPCDRVDCYLGDHCGRVPLRPTQV